MKAGFLERRRIEARPGWSRWLIPPAALSIHLSIGQAYSWSVFKPALEHGLGVSEVQSALPFTVAIIVLGLSAAIFGTQVDSRGPRWAMFVSSCCFLVGFLLTALGFFTSQYWLVLLGYGGVFGIALGIGYISPVSTLMKWFPDRPGLATGIAIMGFGGGALIAAPLGNSLLNRFGGNYTPADTAAGIAEHLPDPAGIGKAFLVLAVGYSIFMALGWLLIRVPAPGWQPQGWDPGQVKTHGLITTNNVSANNALKTPQFWLLWVVLCFNTTAGIGILEKASPMFQEYFPGVAGLAAAAAGFVAILSLANSIGRFCWSTLSDTFGRKNMYRLYLGVGALLYFGMIVMGNSNKPLFLVSTILIISFYGAGFATVPAYLRDLFGTYQVGAIHGRLLTAWSTAGVLGPVIINAISEQQHEAGLTGPPAFQPAFIIMVVLLVIGFVCNELIRPVQPKYFEPVRTAQANEKGAAHE
nr:OFA family MFS transporter [Leucobacter exalbidus]